MTKQEIKLLKYVLKKECDIVEEKIDKALEIYEDLVLIQESAPISPLLNNPSMSYRSIPLDNNWTVTCESENK